MIALSRTESIEDRTKEGGGGGDKLLVCKGIIGRDEILTERD